MYCMQYHLTGARSRNRNMPGKGIVDTPLQDVPITGENTYKGLGWARLNKAAVSASIYKAWV